MGSKSVAVGHKYKITIKREEQTFTITYFDLTDNVQYAELVAANTNFPKDDVVVHVIAQEGTYEVSAPDLKIAEPVVDDNIANPNPCTDFNNIASQPAIKYTFDSASEIETAGGATVADGVLKLVPTTKNGETYAKLPDVTKGYDFSDGITITSDIKYDKGGDWTTIFTFGDGTIGKKGEDATGVYHFTEGLSSVGNSRASATVETDIDWNKYGYFGNTVSAPYTWDYFSNEANRKSWYTITITITKNKMSTYINGVLVQTKDDNFEKVMDVFKVANNNYIGTSYWSADADFAGSLDNVGIYEGALSDADIRALTSATSIDVEPIKTPAPLASYPLYTPTPTVAPALPSVAPEPTPVLDPETLTSSEWWSATGLGRDYTLKGEGTLDLYVKFDAGDSAGYGAFTVELLSDGNKYITTNSNTEAWVAEAGEGTISGALAMGGGGISSIVPGHVYKISIIRTGYDFAIVYYDLTDDKEYFSMKVAGTNQGVDVNAHVRAQVGTYTVSQTAPDSVTPVATATPDASASPEPGATTDPNGTPAPGNNDNNNTPGDNNTPGNNNTPGGNDTPQTPNDTDEPKDDEKDTKKTMKVSGIKAKKNTKKVTGTVSVKGAKVKVKIGKKAYKNAKVSGKKFTFKASSKLKKGTKITIKVTKSGYKTVTKTVKVK